MSAKPADVKEPNPMATPAAQTAAAPNTVPGAKLACDQILQQVGKTFVGKQTLLKKVLAGTLANGHILFEDYPGLGKTLLVKTFSRVTGCTSARIQFTPDILPADIIGAKVYDPKSGTFSLKKGPIFTNICLADEINRAPPKTQSALLEAMEERQVSIEGDTMKLATPFLVLATQNPIEQEGTYPLPEAQMDRFLLKLSTGYPNDLKDEAEILRRRVQWKKNDPTDDIRAVCTQDEFVQLMQTVETQVFVHDQMLEYIAKIIRALRDHAKVEVGPSPRGALAMMRVARASALIHGRDFMTPDDVKLFSNEVLSHRTILNMDDVIEGKKPADIVEEVINTIEVPTHFRQKA